MSDLSRINTAIDVHKLLRSIVVIVGLGGAADMARNLARCGIRHFRLIDFDRVDETNIARQGHDAASIGQSKVESVAAQLKAINAKIVVETFDLDVTTLDESDETAIFGDADVVLACTDNFQAQARISQLTLTHSVPTVFSGLYQGGVGAENFWWHPGMPRCFRCYFKHRYDAYQKADESGQTRKATSQGTTILDVTISDSIAAMLAIGLLTRGSDDRFGRLIQQLGDRQLLVTKLDPTWEVAPNRDLVRAELGIAPDCAAYFAFNTIAITASAQSNDDCPDCDVFRG